MPTPQRPRAARTTVRPARRLRARLVWRPNTPAAAERPDGFTLVELIVAIVLIGLLAALAVPAFRAVTGRVHDRVALAEMAAVSRHAAALISLDGATSVGFSEEALAASLAGAPEAYASDDRLLTDPTPSGFALLLPGLSSETYGEVSWDIADDGEAIGLAMRSRSGRCAWVTGDRTGAVQEGVTAAPEGQCIRLADGSEGGGTEGDGPGPAIPDPEDFPYDDIECGQLAPMTAASEECKVPDEDDPVVGDPIDAPAPGGHDPTSDTSTFHALTSFVHPSWPAPHRMLVTQPASGRVVMVRQNSNTVPGNASARVFATGLPNASGIVVGPDPSTPAGGGVLVLYPVYVGTSANGGSIVRIQPETRTKTTVATNLGGTPTSLATGARCLTASGSFTSGWCIYATVGDTVKTVNVNNGAVTTIHTADTELRAVQPIAGPALVVSSAAGTHTVTGAQLSGTTPAALPATTSPATGGLTWQGNHPAGTQSSLVGTWGTNPAGLVGPSGQSVTLPDATDVHAHGNLDTLYATAGSCVTRVSWRGDATLTPGSVRATPSVAPLWCAGGTTHPSTAEVLRVTTVLRGETGISTVDVDGDHVYFTDGTRLRRTTVAGATPVDVVDLAGHLTAVEGLSVRGNRAWVTGVDSNSRLLVVDLTSGTVVQRASSQNAGCCWTRSPVALSDTSALFSSGGSIRRDDNGTITTVFSTGHSWVRALAVHGDRVYWQSASALYRSGPGFTLPVESLGAHQAPWVSNTVGSAFAAGKLYYPTDSGTQLVRYDPDANSAQTLIGTVATGDRDGVGTEAAFGRISDVAASTDGTTLIVADQGNNSLRVLTGSAVVPQQPVILPTVDIVTGRTQPLVTANAPINGVTYEPRSGRVYYVAGTELYHTTLAGGSSTLVTDLEDHGVRIVYDMAASGDHVYVVGYDASSRLLAIDPDSGLVRTLRSAGTAAAHSIKAVTVAPDGSLVFAQAYGFNRLDPGGNVTTLHTQSNAYAGMVAPYGDNEVLYTHHSGLFTGQGTTVTTLHTSGTMYPSHLSGPSAGGVLSGTTVYTGSRNNNYLVRTDLASGTVTPVTIAGGPFAGSVRAGTGQEAWFGSIRGVAVAPDALLVADGTGRTLWRVTDAGHPSMPRPPGPAGPVADDTATRTTLATTTGTARAVTTDGTHVYYSDGNLIRKVPVGGGTATTVAELTGYDLVYSADFGGDTLYLIARPTGGSASVVAVDPASGAVLRVQTGGSTGASGLRSLSVNPDGRVVYAAGATVNRYGLDGQARPVLSMGNVYTAAITEHAGRIYTLEIGTIKSRAPGESSDTNLYANSGLVPGGFTNHLGSVRVGGDWYLPGNGGTSITRARLDGTSIATHLTGLAGVTDLAIGPDGAIYVAETTTGDIVRVR